MSASAVRLRPAVAADAETIVRFNAALAEETESLCLDRERLGRGVRALLADPSRGWYVVAERDSRVVGQIMVTFEWSDWRDGCFWWIQSVYVEPEHRRAGVFRALYREVERRARAEGSCCGLRLYVERANERAHATYASLGMARSHYLVYETDFALSRG